MSARFAPERASPCTEIRKGNFESGEKDERTMLLRASGLAKRQKAEQTGFRVLA
jgi:hypothetical protein